MLRVSGSAINYGLRLDRGAKPNTALCLLWTTLLTSYTKVGSVVRK